MPIKRNFYIKAEHTKAVDTAAKITNRIAPSRVGFESVEEMLASVNSKRDKLQTQRETRYTLADGVAVFRNMWSSLFKQYYPDQIPDVIFATRHVPRIKRQFVSPLRDGNVLVSDFLTFIFEQWGMCRYNRAFKKFKHYPQNPALDWLLKYSAIYIRLHTDYRLGIPVEDEHVEEEPVRKTKTDEGKNLKRLVRLATDEISKRDREIAKLRAENKRLQSKTSRAKPSSTATHGKPIPKWE